MVKRWIEGLLRTAWRSTSPLRRPLLRRFDAHLASQLDGLHKRFADLEAQQRQAMDELLLVQDCLTREIMRSQYQLANLKQAVIDLGTGAPNISVHTEPIS